ncbi:MAG TPA: hypothetical protein VIK66_12845 [Gaiellaceae bacterium]
MARKRPSSHRRGFKDLVHLWVELFDEHELLTSAAAIALRALIANRAADPAEGAAGRLPRHPGDGGQDLLE